MSEDDARPLSDRSAARGAIGWGILGAFLCLGLILAAMGWLGADRPLSLAFIYATAPLGAVYCSFQALRELRTAAGHRRRPEK